MTASVRDLNVMWVPASSLSPYARNPRSHTRKQIRQIAKSIETFGWTNPLLIGGDDTVIGGHARLEAAKLNGIENVPVIRLADMTETQKRAYVIADNKLAENAGWDRDALKLELEGLIDIDAGFDVTITGFEMGEIDVLLGCEANDDEAPIPKIDPTEPTVTHTGDIWLVGTHRLLCADATRPESFERLMGDLCAEMVFSDPPFNVPIAGHVSGLGSTHHREFAMASGEMTDPAFIAFLQTVLAHMAGHSVDGSIAFICIDWRHILALLTAGGNVFDELKNLCVWAKTNAGMGSLYRSQHELIAVFKKGKAPHINNVDLGRHGRHRSNVWTYAGMNTFGRGRDDALAMHPTVKPIGMVRDAILDCSNRNGIVLDAFVGSGTTLIAAERAGRRAFGMEIDPQYVDVALRRFRSLTGVEPIHADSGATFAQMEEGGSRDRTTVPRYATGKDRRQKRKSAQS